MIKRYLRLPHRQSFFLFGPRQTGKSTFIEHEFGAHAWKIDLLLTDTFLKYSKEPSLFRDEALEKIQTKKIRTIFVDEVQRISLLLNEIQHLMGRHPSTQFILTGSSARKLRRGGANLLGGRALEYHLFPYVYEEIKDKFRLDDTLRYGTLPGVFGRTDSDKTEILSAYVNTYLSQEIQAEGIVRNLGGFSRFLDLAAEQSGELVSFSAIARECQLPVRTVQSYYEILEDTLVGFRLPPWRKSLRKRLVGHSKFYLFDTGVTNAIQKRLTAHFDHATTGKLFEQWIVLETHRLTHYAKSEANLYFWRSNTGAEVDLLIEKHGKILGAFEIKSTPHLSGAHLSGIRSFKEDSPNTPCYLVTTSEHARFIEDVKVLPWRDFLSLLGGLL